MDAGASLRVFISYQPEDTARAVDRLCDRLTSRLGAASVAMHADEVEFEADAAATTSNAVRTCDVLLVVIGPRWASAVTSAGHRLDDRHDRVMAEIATALEANLWVIPVLIGGAPMPDPATLPQRARGLARYKAMGLSTVRWLTDLEALLAALERLAQGSAGTEPAGFGLPSGDGGRSTLAQPAEPSATTPRHRLAWPCGVTVAALAVVATILVLAPGRPGMGTYDEIDALMRIEPASGPMFTTIFISGEECRVPDGWRIGETHFGIRDPRAHGNRASPDSDQRPLHPGRSWRAELRIPEGATPGFDEVHASCWAVDPDGQWRKFYEYPSLTFEVIER